MAEWEGPVSGKFYNNLFASKSHPPVLVVDIPDKDRFDYIYTMLSEEQFLRIRRIAARYKYIVLNSIGDATKIDKGVLDYDSCKIDIYIEISEPDVDTRTKLDNSPVWSLLFVRKVPGKEHKDKICILVDKQTEEIIYRRHVLPHK